MRQPSYRSVSSRRKRHHLETYRRDDAADGINWDVTDLGTGKRAPKIRTAAEIQSREHGPVMVTVAIAAD